MLDTIGLLAVLKKKSDRLEKGFHVLLKYVIVAVILMKYHAFFVKFC